MSARPGSYHAHRRATTRTARYGLLDTVEQLADALDDARGKLADEAGSVESDLKAAKAAITAELPEAA
jgi:hypothetical protein